MVRALQPQAVIDNRGYDEGDYDTPERHVPEGRRFTRPTEACQSVGRESWGHRADEDYYSSLLLLQSIDRIWRGVSGAPGSPCDDGITRAGDLEVGDEVVRGIDSDATLAQAPAPLHDLDVFGTLANGDSR